MRKAFAFALFLLFAVLLLLPDASHIAGQGGALRHYNPQDLDDLSFSWNIERIEVPQAWQRTAGSEDVVVAIIDSGIDSTLPELADRMWTNEDEIPGNGIDDDENGYIDDFHGWDFRDDDSSSMSGSKIHWHGTFIAGIVAAQPDTGSVLGVAPGIRIMDLRFLDSKNRFYGRDWKKLVQAIDYAVENGARVINLSLYANGQPPLILERALERAAKHGVMVVGISGNDASFGVCYPGKYSTVLAVSATDRDDHLASFSNYGREVRVAAPGDKISSLFPGGAVGTSSGTSFSAPHVSGTLALILSCNPSLSAAEAVRLLEETSMDIGSSGRDKEFGAGLIDAGRAVDRTL